MNSLIISLNIYNQACPAMSAQHDSILDLHAYKVTDIVEKAKNLQSTICHGCYYQINWQNFKTSILIISPETNIINRRLKFQVALFPLISKNTSFSLPVANFPSSVYYLVSYTIPWACLFMSSSSFSDTHIPLHLTLHFTPTQEEAISYVRDSLPSTAT